MKKILIIILILGLVGVTGLLNINMKNVKAEEYQIEELINQVFKERVNLLSSKDLEEFDSKLENVKNSLSFYFTNSSLLDDSLNELREIYGMAEGYGKFEIVSIVPLIRIYRIDIRDNLAASYVQQFILYRVKSKFIGKISDLEIPKEWLVPMDENRIWRAATSDYYTIIIIKESNEWKIKNFIRGNYDNKPLFVFPKIENIPQPPNKKLPIPEQIRKEIENYTVSIYIPKGVQSPYRMYAAQYADAYWDNYNSPKYPDYSSYGGDCTNYVSQCLFESGDFPMDWNNNGISEDPWSNPAISQEWHINFYSNYKPSYSWSWCPCFDYYILHNVDFPYKGPKGWIETQGYMKLWRGDVVTCDYNYNNIPDHAVIVVAFEYYTGSPLCDSHTPDQFHVYYGNEPIFHSIHIDYEK